MNLRASALFFVCCLWLGFACSWAHAQDAAWFPAGAVQANPVYPELRAGLEAEGVLVRDGRDEQRCNDSACARASARRLGLRLGIFVELEPSAEQGGRGALHVTLSSADGRSADARAPWSDASAENAVRTAYRAAELALELGEQALLRVQSRPQGALVAVDGAAVGLSPLERRVSAGPHTIALSLDGFQRLERRATFEPGRALALDLSFTRDAAAEARTRVSPWNFVLGGALVLGSVPLIASAALTLAAEGNCERRDPVGACVERVHFGTRSGLLLGFGAAALLAGGALLVVRPFTLTLESTPRATSASVSARF